LEGVGFEVEVAFVPSDVVEMDVVEFFAVVELGLACRGRFDVVEWGGAIGGCFVEGEGCRHWTSRDVGGVLDGRGFGKGGLGSGGGHVGGLCGDILLVSIFRRYKVKLSIKVILDVGHTCEIKTVKDMLLSM
jgi:hypothetical protein